MCLNGSKEQKYEYSDQGNNDHCYRINPFDLENIRFKNRNRYCWK